MKKLATKHWWIAIPILPFFIMFLLHISIALGDYFNVNINIPNIYADDWFMFFSSYLGGSVALLGVIFTIRHSMNTHSHQIAMAKIEKEKQDIVEAISMLNPFEPYYLLKQFSLLMENNLIAPENTANLNDRVYNHLYLVNASRVKMLMATNATSVSVACQTCKTPCGLKVIVPELAKDYDSVTENLNKALNELANFTTLRTRNDRISRELNQYIQENAQSGTTIHSQEKINKLNDEYTQLSKQIETLIELCEKCNSMNANEISRIVSLSKGYIAQRQENAKKHCFEDWKGGQ